MRGARAALKTKGKNRLIAVGVVLLLLGAFFLYAAIYYRADDKAKAALRPDGRVQISRTDYGWLFDGPSETDALIFYPGGKVEETAYAPLLRLVAEQGMDVCLVKMPLHLAVLAPNRADRVMAEYDYENWYLGGHSLGGAVAANYAADHGEGLRGLVLLAAYPTHALPASLRVLTIVGSEDRIVNRDKLEAGAQYLPEGAVFFEIPGGNHARFGSYGPQRGDGEALLPPEEQWAETAAIILETMG